ncbi:DUF6095 family protein [Flavobacteriaceae bacterium 14752]|uniref:DUF6095 family protein n=1 Tax=Mesohalobacter salilacus TaxID=2491711 RepID=UPI000F630D50|nr:hypothetical protein EIG84_01050 [Flavobacteriaceae bacterium 14752]
MDRKHTNKELLKKGIKYLAVALPLSLLGPSVLYSAFNNQEHAYFLPVVIIGFLLFFGAMFCIFKGIMTIVKAIFD